MAESLLSPPMSRASTPQDSSTTTAKDELTNRLDELLEQHLGILDEYSSLREKLSETFTDGFMSLARAQRTSNLGPGRRYGQDGYDGRMKALKRVRIERTQHFNDSKASRNSGENTVQKEHSESTNQGPEFYTFLVTSRSGSNATKKKSKVVEEPDAIEPKLSSLETPAISPDQEHSHEQEKPKADPAYRDPVTWFGILVPPPLRQVQKSFSQSVDDLIPSLLSVTSRMQSLESQIRAVRTTLGIQSFYSENDSLQLPHRPIIDSAK